MKIAFLIGTRPEVIKISPAIRECQKRNIDFFIISSNQHYDDALFSNFLKELDFPEIEFQFKNEFEIQSCYEFIIKILKKERPYYIWVGGDTDTAFVGALAGWDCGISVIHREAGVRSFDRRMHEEKNRIMIDKLSAVRFAPTKIAMSNLNKENAFWGSYRTGNLIADAVDKMYDPILDKPSKPYIFITIHRRENIEKASTLRNMMENILSKTEGTFKIFSAHPNIVELMIQTWGAAKDMLIVSPVDYKTSLTHIKNSKFVITDSGGIQEEACILGTPCVVLRKTSDRPETIDCGAAILIDPDSKNWKIKFKKKKWKHPYGENVAIKMFDILEAI